MRTREGFENLGLYRVRGTVPREVSFAMSRSSRESRMRDDRIVEGGYGNRVRRRGYCAGIDR